MRLYVSLFIHWEKSVKTIEFLSTNAVQWLKPTLYNILTKGNRRTLIGTTSGSSDHIVEMIPPVNTLGREFLTSYLYERTGDVFRIIGK